MIPPDAVCSQACCVTLRHYRTTDRHLCDNDEDDVIAATPSIPEEDVEHLTPSLNEDSMEDGTKIWATIGLTRVSIIMTVSQLHYLVLSHGDHGNW